MESNTSPAPVRVETPASTAVPLPSDLPGSYRELSAWTPARERRDLARFYRAAPPKRRR